MSVDRHWVVRVPVDQAYVPKPARIRPCGSNPCGFGFVWKVLWHRHFEYGYYLWISFL